MMTGSGCDGVRPGFAGMRTSALATVIYAIEARNHRFSGGRKAFDAALLDALAWMVPAASTTTAAMPSQMVSQP